MTALLYLAVTTPLQQVLQDDAVASLRGEDDSGDFGILPGHADFVTVIEAGILRWRGATGPWRFCALRGGVLEVSQGTTVRIACREAIPGDDLATLQAKVAEARAALIEAGRTARTRDTRLHARAIRRLMQGLGGDPLGLDEEEA